MKYHCTWVLLLGALLFLLEEGDPLYAQEPRGEVKSVEVSGESVTITYELQGDADTEYEIRIFLVPSRQAGAPRELAMVRGDVGKGKYAGAGRRIVWNMRELPDIRQGESFIFRISVDKPGIPWYYWVGGGAAVLGGVAALVFKGNEESQQTPAPTNPLPPSR